VTNIVIDKESAIVTVTKKTLSVEIEKPSTVNIIVQK